MKQRLEEIKKIASEEISKADSGDALESIRIKYLGKKGELTAILRGMGALSPEERPIMGQVANDVRAEIESILNLRSRDVQNEELSKRLLTETLDVTMPSTPVKIGGAHPMTKVLEEIFNIFTGMGFSIADGPEIENNYYNFDALNIPENHPSRDPQDTFYINDSFVLRTQTSPIQARVMEKQKPPIRILAPGRVYRVDEVDATHSPVFYQIEGLVVDKHITMGDLKGTLNHFVKSLYGSDVKTRFRPHHFPFTEPSAEMDMSCFKCNGAGCSMCKGEGYIELLGCGMVHPNVLRGCGIDPEVYSGFAFGMGLDRVVMRRFMIDDLRLLTENDIRFLSQF